MRHLSRSLSEVNGRRVLLALGGTYAILAVGYPFISAFEDVPLATDVILAVLVGGPGIVLLYSGYRLPETDIRPEFYVTIAGWCLGGIGVILGILGLIEIATDLRDPVQNILILTALASVAGLVAGRYDARAKTRTRELKLRNRELERTKDDLEGTVRQLRTANERLERFAYAASHDLQEPLRMVSSYLRLLDHRYEDELDEDAREFIDFAVGGADRMRAMVESLREYSRVSTEGEPLELTDSGVVVETVLRDLQDRIEETGATISVDELPTVKADPDQLAIVFENLLSNALTFSGDDPPRVHIHADYVDGAWRFATTDEGIGIESEYHDQVFTVFENLNTGEEDSTVRNSGVGLALCERIVERHGGEIWVDSATGEGATFYFTIPTAVNHESDSLDSTQPDEHVTSERQPDTA